MTHIVGGVLLWVVCVFRRVDVVCWCLLCIFVILSAVFCVIGSLLMFVSDASGESSPKMLTITPLSGTRTLMAIDNN